MGGRGLDLLSFSLFAGNGVSECSHIRKSTTPPLKRGFFLLLKSSQAFQRCLKYMTMPLSIWQSSLRKTFGRPHLNRCA